MQKSLYSLILMDDVVREIDSLARMQNTNRSNLINQILADYVSLTTPEKRINNIFNCINGLLEDKIFNSYIEPHERTMSLKSSLNYRYRPTIKYEVELYRSSSETIGELKIIFRTQSAELLIKLSDFFDLWTRMEHIYLKDYFGADGIQYSFDNGKITRSLHLPHGKEYSNDEIAKAISDYIRMFDDIIKGYLTGEYTSVTQMENRYLSYLNNSIIL